MSLQVVRTAVVLDQYPLWIDALHDVLRPLGLDVVAKTTNVATALDAVATVQPALFLVDLDIGERPETGLECMRRARELAPAVAVIALSGNSDADLVDTAFAAGAAAFVVKTAQPEDLVAATRQVFDHSIFLRPAHRPRQRAAAVPAPSHGTHRLTRRELEILRLVSLGHSNAQVARTLWVTEQTVKFHLSNIYRKLDVGNRTEASRWAQIHGVLAPEDVPEGVDA